MPSKQNNNTQTEMMFFLLVSSIIVVIANFNKKNSQREEDASVIESKFITSEEEMIYQQMILKLLNQKLSIPPIVNMIYRYIEDPSKILQLNTRVLVQVNEHDSLHWHTARVLGVQEDDLLLHFITWHHHCYMWLYDWRKNQHRLSHMVQPLVPSHVSCTELKDACTKNQWTVSGRCTQQCLLI